MTVKIKKSSVLVVDDDHSVRTLISATLARQGYDVTMATNGRIGVEHVRAAPQRFKLILIDYQMPEMDGVTACKVMKECAPDAPVILMSTESAPDGIKNCGVQEFLSKPFEAAELLSLVDRNIAS